MSSSDGGERVSAELAGLLTRLSELARATPEAPAPELVDQIAVLEQMRSAVAAAQHTAIVAFGRAQVETQSALIADGHLDHIHGSKAGGPTSRKGSTPIGVGVRVCGTTRTRNSPAGTTE